MKRTNIVAIGEKVLLLSGKNTLIVFRGLTSHQHPTWGRFCTKPLIGIYTLLATHSSASNISIEMSLF